MRNNLFIRSVVRLKHYELLRILSRGLYLSSLRLCSVAFRGVPLRSIAFRGSVCQCSVSWNDVAFFDLLKIRF